MDILVFVRINELIHVKQCLEHCKYSVSLSEMHNGMTYRTKFAITMYIVNIWNCNIVVGLFLEK